MSKPDVTDFDQLSTSETNEVHQRMLPKAVGVSRVESTGAPEPGPGLIDPMLASTFEGDLEAVDEGAFVAERKYDGTRLILEKFDGEISLYTRRHVEGWETLRELTATATLPDGRIMDGEYTFLTPDGQSCFTPIHAGQAALEEKGSKGRISCSTS